MSVWGRISKSTRVAVVAEMGGWTRFQHEAVSERAIFLMPLRNYSGRRGTDVFFQYEAF